MRAGNFKPQNLEPQGNVDIQGQVVSAESKLSLDFQTAVLMRNLIQESFGRKAHDLSSDENLGNVFVDVFSDATGIDDANSENYQHRGAANYDVTKVDPTEMDYMEYASDGAAQAAYVSDAAGTINPDTKLMLHGNGINGSKEIQDSGNTGHVVEINGYSIDKVPDMTSNTAPSGEVDSSNSISTAYKVFDDFGDGHWDSEVNGTGWIQYKFTSGKVITKVTLQCDVSSPQRMPKDFTIKGSHNGSSWTTLKTVTGESPWETSERRGYTLTNSTLYTYYRVDVTDTENPAQPLEIGEIEFMESANLSTSQKKFGSSSMGFNGIDTYLTLADHADWYFGTDNFTVDLWVRFNNLTNEQNFFVQFQGGTYFFVMRKDATTHKLRMQFYNGSEVGNYLMTDNWSPSINTWYHLAFVRNGTTGLIFIDGVPQTLTEVTAFSTNDVGDLAGMIYIGSEGGGGGSFLNGYMDELRVSKGIARWTSDFSGSLPSSEYSSDANTKLLLHMNTLDISESYHIPTFQGMARLDTGTKKWGTAALKLASTDVKLLINCNGADGSTTFTDISRSPHTVTAQGTAEVDTAQSKFGGASLLLVEDGGIDYLSVPDHADWDFGSGDFTIDCWVRKNSSTSEGAFFSHWDDRGTSNNGRGFMLRHHGAETGIGVFYSTTGDDENYSAHNTTDLLNGVWYHIAFVRSGNNGYLFVNGKRDATTINFTGVTIYDSSEAFMIGACIGATGNPALLFDGWIDDVRVIKGTALWTSDFAPPGKEATLDYLTLPDSADWEVTLQTNFTIDFWVKHDTPAASTSTYICQDDVNDDGWEIRHSGVNGLKFYAYTGGGSYVDTGYGGVISDTNWHHIAICKVGSKYAIYLDGSQVGYTDDADTGTSTGLLYIGRMRGGQAWFDGYMDEIRIQHSNIFGAAPVVGLTNTIIVPTQEYSSVGGLQSYSEDSIINQGTYSLKTIANQTTSLDKTLTKSSLSIDLSDVDTLKFDVYASRTGTNLRMKIHDSGGQTSTKDILISSADTWTEITWDISGISNANKDDIDQIIIEILNADSANTFYIDNFFAPADSATVLCNVQTLPSGTDTILAMWEENVPSGDTITVYISANNGAGWTEITNPDSYASAVGTTKYKKITGLSGTQGKIKAVITGAAELESWGFAW